MRELSPKIEKQGVQTKGRGRLIKKWSKLPRKEYPSSLATNSLDLQHKQTDANYL